MTEKADIASTSNSPTPVINPPLMNGSYHDLKNKLAEKMAGEITLSDNPEKH